MIALISKQSKNMEEVRNGKYSKDKKDVWFKAM